MVEQPCEFFLNPFGSGCNVRTQDPENFDEEVKSLVTAWRIYSYQAKINDEIWKSPENLMSKKNTAVFQAAHHFPFIWLLQDIPMPSSSHLSVTGMRFQDEKRLIAEA